MICATKTHSWVTLHHAAELDMIFNSEKKEPEGQEMDSRAQAHDLEICNSLKFKQLYRYMYNIYIYIYV